MLAEHLDPMLVENVEALAKHADLLSVEIRSHRKLLGGLTVGMMRAARTLMTHVLTEQTSYNRLTLETLEQLLDEHARLALETSEATAIGRRLESLEHSVEYLGLEHRAFTAGLGRIEKRLEVVEDMLQRLSGTPTSPAVEFDHVRFAERFRGPESFIHDRQVRYAELFRGCTNVVDLGCGRGEFLQVLGERGIRARGVDVDEGMVAACRAKGLDVRQQDLFDCLRIAREGEFDGVFCAQVIEHLTVGQLLSLLDLCAMRMTPGGVLVLETLNPESLFVHYRWFWMDPTHVRLVHPQALAFFLEERGFHDLRFDFLPVPEGGPVQLPPLSATNDGAGPQSATDPSLAADARQSEETQPRAAGDSLHEFNRATRYLNELLYASTDYAAIATR